MRKLAMSTGVIALLVSLVFVLSQCGDDAGTISGTVKLDDQTMANGAIVVLSKSANAADVVATSVADADGVYSISAIEGGSYFLSASWEPSNNNNEKAANTVILSSEEVEVTVDGDVNEDIVLSGMVSGGAAMVDLADGWVFDNTHSTIEFEFPYDAVNAIFTGHFASAGFDVLHFDEATPANTEIKAWVDLISIETGSAADPCGHTRDGIEGCIAGTFGVELDPADTTDAYCQDGTLVTSWPNETPVEYDLWGDGSTTSYRKQSAVVSSTGVATLEVTDAVAYGTGYKAKADFTFNGVTESVDLYFNYLEGYDSETKSLCSFFGWFKFPALAAFGIESGHVGSANVTVKISAQFNKALEQ